MGNWQVVFLYTKRETLLMRAVKAAFPEAAFLHVPALKEAWNCEKKHMLDYFHRWVYDSGLWSGRVLTIYGTGGYHHWTYALSKLALERRGLGDFDWTYFHWDQHRDDWGYRGEKGQLPRKLACGSFVDSIVHNHRGIPFFVGPGAYPFKDSRGYTIKDTHIPIYNNFFTKELQRSLSWKNNSPLSHQTGLELPSVRDLRATPTESYLTFDLDLLAYSEIVTDYDQNEAMTLRRVCRMLDHVRPYKRIFSADILGYADEHHHPLSALTVVILARKIMGLGIQRLLEYHTYAKRKQAAGWNQQSSFQEWVDDLDRKYPIEEGELMEVLK